MAKVRVAAATWEYRNAAGARRRAFFGDVVDVPADEMARGRALGVLRDAEAPAAAPDHPVPAPEIPAAEVVDLPELPDRAVPAGSAPTRPKSASSTETWRQYAVAKGIPAEQAARMSKVEIREATR